MTFDEGLINRNNLFCGRNLLADFATNLYAGILSALTIGVYVFVYTPLKRVTTSNTIVGAIPGALPPVIGWTAARGPSQLRKLDSVRNPFLVADAAFSVDLWLYREDYKQAGFVMLASFDPACQVRASEFALHNGVDLGEFYPGHAGTHQFPVSPRSLHNGQLLSLMMAFRFAISGTNQAARRLFVHRLCICL